MKEQEKAKKNKELKHKNIKNKAKRLKQKEKEKEVVQFMKEDVDQLLLGESKDSEMFGEKN